MSYVEINAKDLKRLLSILSSYFGNKPMTNDDMKLKQKLEVMHEAEVEWEKD